MSLYKDYEDYVSKKRKCQEKPMAHLFFHQEKRYVKPFSIYGNVYYVGDSWVCVHLIDTGEGLLLIDAGNACATPWLVQAIWEAGFRPNDVKWIVLSHGHVDHVGGAEFFRNTFGTKLYMAQADAQMFREHPELSFIQDSPSLLDQVFEPDVCIQDGDILAFGPMQIQCCTVPGHTEGCVALFFDAHQGAETKRCGYYGGFGFNTLTCEHLEEIGDPEYRMWKVYEESLDKVMDQQVDIFLGNHTENNRTLEKAEEMTKGAQVNPFVDREEWRKYLEKKKEELHAFIKRQLEAKAGR
ncbi:MAG: MBL fold metallo-hydrolase [Lachnospiraceae bacterium]|nr:MBL fold metallo-hydrolase [Lachnospiraceae bacterium]